MMASRPASALSNTKSTAISAVNSFYSIKHFLARDDNIKQKIFDVSKLVIVTGPLVIALLIMASLALSAANNESKNADVMMGSLTVGDKMSFIINSLQKERGITCVYLNSQNSATLADVEQQMRQFRDDTDVFIDDLDVWIETEMFHSKMEFRFDIKVFRLKIPHEVSACDQVLEHYTGLINFLFAEMQSVFAQSQRGHFWITLEGYMAILKVKDLIGLKRATGGAFFAAAEYDYAVFQEFIGLSNTAKLVFTGVENTLPVVHEDYLNLTLHHKDVIDVMDDLEHQIMTTDPSTHQADSNKSLLWFETVTLYMKFYTELEHHVHLLVQESLHELNVEIQVNYHYLCTIHNNQATYDTSLWIVIAVSVICPPLLIGYFVNYQKLLSQMQRFAGHMQHKQADLKKQKQQSEVLLHQLLPKQLAKEIQAGQPIDPEQFDSVTVFFSDIHGFSVLSSGCTPFQTVEILNTLYSTIDAILEVYDVYKVETISSSYLIASGLPIRSDHHSEQICSMALDVLRTMSYFNIPHKPWENLLIRIGCHTGPLAAGVVGLKMPRYCVFGDTVNTAARMETTGYPNRIQISSKCRKHLNESFPGEFDTVFRQKLQIKGKGDMDTYWVLGRKGNTFKVSLQKSEAILGFTEYWREETGEATEEAMEGATEGIMERAMEGATKGTGEEAAKMAQDFDDEYIVSI